MTVSHATPAFPEDSPLDSARSAETQVETHPAAPAPRPGSLRWGILATGFIAGQFTSDALTAGLDVRAVGSRSAESAQRFATTYGIPRAHDSYEALVADPEVDIVYVATPHPMHRETAGMALEAGKHVLVEKPFTLNRAEAVELRDLAARRGLLVMEAMWTRYLPHMRRIREIIAAGGIGEVRTVFADHTQSLPTDPEHRINALTLGGGALLDLGIYPISFAWDILGEPISIQAAAHFGATGADTEVATVMTHLSGALSTTTTSSRAKGPNTAHIVGTEGRIDIDGVWYTSTDFSHRAADGTLLERYESARNGVGMQHQALAAEDYVARGVLGGERLSVDDSVRIMGTLDEIRAQIGLRYPGEPRLR
ncbi:Gfo/Idh/MocA family protein [Nesterenkonia sp. DZ6]|uniref:Gfo/Idh/MocA family protein n=1 Tax=Nesterenkonia sp. DZ6 TaxID=2901229 RepID=UPI001F4C5B1A|nr:Gfo/Idh/MocA family oxidoreductase [Nesterenkonia sp. DZ6]MCH8559735.1 Gfo/Idh/MocA family oxidoreductase [Nesterenkonia sp. DZ6]